MSNHWAKEMRANCRNLKSTFAMQALANYLVLTMSDPELDKLIPLLQDPTKTTTVSISVTDKTEGE